MWALRSHGHSPQCRQPPPLRFPQAVPLAQRRRLRSWLPQDRPVEPFAPAHSAKGCFRKVRDYSRPERRGRSDGIWLHCLSHIPEAPVRIPGQPSGLLPYCGVQCPLFLSLRATKEGNSYGHKCPSSRAAAALCGTQPQRVNKSASKLAATSAIIPVW